MRKLFKILIKLIKYFSILIILIVISIIGFLYYYPKEIIAQESLKQTLSNFGIKNANISISKLNQSNSIFINSHFGDPERFFIKNLKLSYNMDSALNKNIELLEIDGLDLVAVKLPDNSLSLGNLDKLLKQTQKTSHTKSNIEKLNNVDNSIFYIRKILVINSTFTIQGPGQKLILPFNLTVDPEHKDIALEITLTKALLELENYHIPSTGNISLKANFSGELPFIWHNQQLIIKDGKIFSTQAGNIKFLPVFSSSEKNLQTLLNATSNYDYNNFKINFNYNQNNELISSLHLNGSNKNYLDGRLVELNVNLKTDLSDSIRSLLGVYNISSEVLNNLSLSFDKHKHGEKN